MNPFIIFVDVSENFKSEKSNIKNNIKISHRGVHEILIKCIHDVIVSCNLHET